MRLNLNRALFLIVLLICSIVSSQGAAIAAFADIENNWAREDILALDKQGIFEELWEGRFEPHSPISHATSVQLLGRAFALTEAEQGELLSWLQGSFASDSSITRGEFAALLANLLGLGENTRTPTDWYPSFVDLTPDYPGFAGVELLHKLQLLPSHMLVRFEPYRLITKSEVAHLINGALKLRQLSGVVKKIDQEDNLLVLQTEESTEQVKLSNSTIFVTTQGINKGAELEVEEGQNLFVLVRNENALLARFEAETATQAFVQGFNNVAKILADILTPEQVSAIIAGDWDQLNEEVQYELYNELIKRGAAPWEAEALLKQDWGNLQNMLQERLTQEAADYLQVTPELVHSAVTGDWSKLLEYAQVELAQRLLTSDWLKGIGQ